jgi:hypothetical protein
MSTETTADFFIHPIIEILQNAESASDLKNYLNAELIRLGKAIAADNFELRNPNYTRYHYTIGALLSCNSEVRGLMVRSNVNLQEFDAVLNQAMSILQAECNRRSVTGEKLAKTLLKIYQNGSYR